MKKMLIPLWLSLVLLSGCISTDKPTVTPEASLSTTPSSTPEPTAEAVVQKTMEPQITNSPIPTPTAVPSLKPTSEPTYQPIQVTYVPEVQETTKPSKEPEITNHAPVLNLAVLGSTVFEVKENGMAGSDAEAGLPNELISGKNTFSFQIEAADEDNDTISYFISAAAGGTALRELESTYAVISVDVLGKVVYTLKDSSDILSQKERAIDFFMIRAVDQNGLYSEAQITVNIEGTNSAPLLSLPEGHVLSIPAVNEKTITGVISITDVDKDAAAGGWKAENYAYSVDDTKTLTIIRDDWKFSIDVFGNYSFTLYSLSNTGLVEIPLIYEDNHGTSAQTRLSFTINKNTAPVITMEENFSALKEAGINAIISSGIDAWDNDQDTLTYRIKDTEAASMQLSSGSFELNQQDGTFTFTVSETAPIGNYTEVITLIVSDGKHETEKTITIAVEILSVKEPEEVPETPAPSTENTPQNEDYPEEDENKEGQ